MTKYVISITRTLVVEAETPEEATTMSLYATRYPDQISGIEHLSYDTKVELHQNDINKKFESWPESSGNSNK